MNGIMNKDYITMQEMRRYLGISQGKAYQLIHGNHFPVCRIGKLLRIPRKEFMQWLQQQTQGPEGDTV